MCARNLNWTPLGDFRFPNFSVFVPSRSNHQKSNVLHSQYQILGIGFCFDSHRGFEPRPLGSVAGLLHCHCSKFSMRNLVQTTNACCVTYVSLPIPWMLLSHLGSDVNTKQNYTFECIPNRIWRTTGIPFTCITKERVHLCRQQQTYGAKRGKTIRCMFWWQTSSSVGVGVKLLSDVSTDTPESSEVKVTFSFMAGIPVFQTNKKFDKKTVTWLWMFSVDAPPIFVGEQELQTEVQTRRKVFFSQHPR